MGRSGHQSKAQISWGKLHRELVVHRAPWPWAPMGALCRTRHHRATGETTGKHKSKGEGRELEVQGGRTRICKKLSFMNFVTVITRNNVQLCGWKASSYLVRCLLHVQSPRAEPSPAPFAPQTRGIKRRSALLVIMGQPRLNPFRAAA